MKGIVGSGGICGSAARMEQLEARKLLSAVRFDHGMLTIYGSESADDIAVETFSAPGGKPLVAVYLNGTQFNLPAARTRHVRIFTYGGDDDVGIRDTFTANISDVSIDGGDGKNTVTDDTIGHRYNRGEHLSITTGAGNDAIRGGPHTIFIDAGAGNDTLSGGAAGAVLNGGDGNDVVSADYLGLDYVLERRDTVETTKVSLSLNGGAGDDVLVGNSFEERFVQDTLTGGSGNDQFFPGGPTTFSSDLITDLGNGADTQPGLDQFSGASLSPQTASLSLYHIPDGTTHIPPQGTGGSNGPKPKIVVIDGSTGTLLLQGPAGTTWALGDFLNAAGYPVDALGIPSNVSLFVNGFDSTLTGNQIAGYQINPGDVMQLFFGYPNLTQA